MSKLHFWTTIRRDIKISFVLEGEGEKVAAG